MQVVVVVWDVPVLSYVCDLLPWHAQALLASGGAERLAQYIELHPQRSHQSIIQTSCADILCTSFYEVAQGIHGLLMIGWQCAAAAR